jgi:hypothetical protein
LGYNHTGEQLSENAKLAAASGEKPTAPSNQFTVRVADNFHYQDESETYTEGSYATYAEALSVAAQIVCDSLLRLAKPGMSGEKLYRAYTMCGEDAFIVGARPDDPRFSAWGYAKQLCERLHPRGSWGQELADNLNRNVFANVPTN